jgi:hypothetical protein
VVVDISMTPFILSSGYYDEAFYKSDFSALKMYINLQICHVYMFTILASPLFVAASRILLSL